jgi:hypothetical protein
MWQKEFHDDSTPLERAIYSESSRESTPTDHLVHSQSSQIPDQTTNPSSSENKLLEELIKQHPFPSEGARDEHKERVALEFQKAVNEANRPYRKFSLNRNLAQTIKNMPILEKNGHVIWVEREEIEKHILKGGGNVTIGEGPDHENAASQHILFEFLNHLGSHVKKGEAAIEKAVGHYLQDIFSTQEGFEEKQ